MRSTVIHSFIDNRRRLVNDVLERIYVYQSQIYDRACFIRSETVLNINVGLTTLGRKSFNFAHVTFLDI